MPKTQRLDERAAFEAWARDNGHNDTTLHRNSGDARYYQFYAQHAWEAWQAAPKRESSAQEALKKVRDLLDTVNLRHNSDCRIDCNPRLTKPGCTCDVAEVREALDIATNEIEGEK